MNDSQAGEVGFPLGQLPPRGKSGLFLEIFAGKGVLTRAVQHAHGLVCLPAIDLITGPWKLDLRDPRSVDVLSHWITRQRLRWVHFGTPCSSFSCALRRSTRRDSDYGVIGDERDPKVVSGNGTARATAAPIEVCQNNHSMVLGEPTCVCPLEVPGGPGCC